MTQPKAKWSAYDEDTKRIWTAAVGPFYLEANTADGYAELCSYDFESASIGEQLWKQPVSGPCDITDLMRLAEAELARRLRHAAETMDGNGLVALSGPRQPHLQPGTKAWAIVAMKQGRVAVTARGSRVRYQGHDDFTVSRVEDIEEARVWLVRVDRLPEFGWKIE